MLTIKKVLSDKIVLGIECVDRVYLNGVVYQPEAVAG
jgi:hypothetical protein